MIRGLVFSLSVLALATAQFTEVPLPEKAVVFAVPLAGGRQFTTVIVGQLKPTKQCWAEKGTNPTIIDPLLNEFDFSGICSRARDSNGYGLRLAGVDQGWKYMLSTRQVGSDLQLIASPTSGVSASPIVVAQAGGFVAGQMIKLNLVNGFKLTKRAYEGKTLGYYYFS